MAEKFKALYFQMSPQCEAAPDAAKHQRLHEGFSARLRPYIGENAIAFNRGDSGFAIVKQLDDFIQKNAKYEGPLVIAINTHGAKGSGNFGDDLCLGKDVLWTPELFWKMVLSKVKYHSNEFLCLTCYR
jgi:hypothetical protein